MKKTVFSLALMLLGFICLSQNMTEAAAKKLLGERFISSKEAGFTKHVRIPFKKEEIEDDHLSWLIPIQSRDGPKYVLVQALYSVGNEEQQNVLSVNDAIEIANVIRKTKRNFPDKNAIKFFEVKDHSFINGMEYQKMIAFNSGSYSLVNTPLNTSIVLLGKNSVSYIMEDGDQITVQVDLDEENISDTKGYPVMTLVKKN